MSIVEKEFGPVLVGKLVMLLRLKEYNTVKLNFFIHSLSSQGN